MTTTMTAAMITPAGAPVGTQRPSRPQQIVSERTYRRRRAIVGGALAVVIAAASVMAFDVLAGSSGVPASAAASQPALARQSITALPGDSLWSIAERFHGDVSLRRYLETLVDLNGGASIQAGQSVILP